jgi:ABC-type glycerol-3-phosphate transport system substrate-binding protein
MLARLGVLGAGSVLLLSACGGSGGQAANDHVLRIAMGSPGEAQIRVWDDVAKQFMAAHPETKVEINYQQDDLYETIGLQNLLAGRNAPDIYFEWTGERLKQRQKDGYVADITAQFTDGPLKGLFSDDTLKGYSIDGKIVMVPYAADVTNVLWYNKQLLADAGVQPPKTWDDLLAACTALQAKGVIPITTGNKDLWPAGNWFGHLTSRVVGEDVYAATLSGTGKFATPAFEEAFGYIKQLADAKCVNDSANAIDDNAGAQLFFQGKAAMHPIGSWLVSWAIDEAPDLQFDYVNLPAMPSGAKGNQDSVIGVQTGYIMNAKSPKQTEAGQFMALLNSDANVKALIEAEVTPLALSASAGSEIDSRSAALSSMLNNAPAVVLPPDTGYDLKTADAFYTAVAAVLGGQATPADALAEIDRKLGR